MKPSVLRLDGSADLERYLLACDAAFSDRPSDEYLGHLRELIVPERHYVVEDGDAWVATAGSWDFEMSVPGGALPLTAGITMVGVHPTHRRRGLMRALLERQLEDLAEEGEPLAVLWASESAIYPRFGYGLASLHASFKIDRDRAEFLRDVPRTGSMHLIDEKEAAARLPGVYDRVLETTPGLLTRTPEWWEHYTLSDPAEEREGAGPMFRALLEIDGGPEAYALYRVKQKWAHGVSDSTLEVIEAFAPTAQATHEVWSFLFGVDLVAHVRGRQLPLDHPLFDMVADARRLRWTLADGLWLRVIDVPAALAERTYMDDGELVLAVSDRILGTNDGTWRLSVEEGLATLERTDDAPDLVLDIAELGEIYLGGRSLQRLVRAGRVEERTEDAAWRADNMFASERMPFCPEIW